MTSTRPAARSFQNMVENISFRLVGGGTAWQSGAAYLEDHRVLDTMWSIILRHNETEAVLRQVLVQFVNGRYHVMTNARGQYWTLGEFKTRRAAVGMALDYVAAPAWLEGMQSEPDAFMV